MFPDLFANSNLPMLSQVVEFSQARHGVLAGNIANMNTPDYKTRDLSPEAFQQSLKQAVASKPGPSLGEAALLRSGPGLTVGGTQGTGAKETSIDYDQFADVRKSMTSVLYHDGTDVSLEHQVTEISKNQAQHNLAISIMSLQFRQLQSAISERVV